MRLRRLRLERYGCFEHTDLQFATEPGHITMLVAPNGAGKSVLRRAFHDLLFDIPMQSPMKFRHGYPGMALHAEAIGADGQPFEFGWVRGGKPQPRVTTDPVRFAALQQGVTPHQLERLFALDTKGLRDGGTDLKGGATLAGALLAGTGELTPAKSVRAIIEARRQANWGPGKSKPPLNAAAGRLEAARAKARAAVHRPEKREREERELDEARQQLAAAKQDRDTALAKSRRLNRVALTRPHLLQLLQAEEWLATHPDAPALPPGLDQQLAAARGAVATAQAAHDQAQQALERMRESTRTIARDPAATALADRIGTLGGLLGGAENSTRDIAKRRAEHATKRDDVRLALRAIGADVPDSEAGAVIPTVGLMAEARAAITAGVGLHKELALAEERFAKARKAEAATEAEPVAARALPVGLVALLAEVRADRSPVQHASDRAEAARKAAAAVRRALALVPSWPGTAEALRALPIPTEDALERLNGDSEAARARAAAASARAASLAAEHHAAHAALEALHQQSLPDTDSIMAARAERNRGMRLVLHRAYGQAPGVAEERAYAGDEPVALVYERQVRSADELADRRTAELERVQEAERLGRELAIMVAHLPIAESDRKKTQDELEEAEQAWSETVAPLGLGRATTMAELRKILATRQLLVDAMSEAEIASGSEAALAIVLHEWSVRLAALLQTAAEPIGALLARADDRVASAGKAEHTALKRQAKLESAQRENEDATEAQDRANRALQAWAKGWARMLGHLHRPDGETPEALAAVLDGMMTVDQHHRTAISLEGRIAAMEADLARFAAIVTGLASGLGEPALETPMATARALIARATKAAAAESACRQAEIGLDRAATDAALAKGGLYDACTKLDAVIAACGAATAGDAEARIAASRAHAEQDAARRAARQSLLEHGDGLTLADLQADSDAVPADAMAARREEAEQEARAAGSRAEAAAVTLDKLETTMGDEAVSSSAIDARADQEAATAEFSRRLEDQLVLHLASTMLGAAMRSVEDGMGSSSLALVSKAFAAVTDEAYTLETQEGPDGEELHAVERAYPRECKSLGDLSEGTRDQLYLALRMVALREHCANATALPFIADDILQTFDDSRAAAALRALIELSNDLQVVVLTHHTHLRTLAAGLDTGRIHLLQL